ncbi:hypothetical protein BGX27_005197 [Mortierella sp. AM989]|nr:hypothetical protein BGX27_005197 [Mortierella sp. AM989]
MSFCKELELKANSMPESWRPYVIKYSALKKQIGAIVQELHDRKLPSSVTMSLSKSMSDDVERMERSFDDSGKPLKSCIKIELNGLSKLLPREKESLMFSAQQRFLLNNVIPPPGFGLEEQKMTDDHDGEERSKAIRPVGNLHFSSASVAFEETSLSTVSSTTSSRLAMPQTPNSGATYCFCSDTGLGTAITTGIQYSTLSLAHMSSPPSQPFPSPNNIAPLNLLVLSPEQTDEEPMESLVAPGALSKQTSPSNSNVNLSNGNIYQSKSRAFIVEENSKRLLIIELTEDTAFFDQLGKEISQLSKLQHTNKQELESKVEDLSKMLIVTSSPYNKDMYTWREILKIYQEAQVFVSDQESDRSARSSEKALGQLQWFLREIERNELISNFKQAKSKTTFNTFLKLNSELITMLQFKELNQMVMTKILEQHDKRTSLA